MPELCCLFCTYIWYALVKIHRRLPIVLAMGGKSSANRQYPPTYLSEGGGNCRNTGAEYASTLYLLLPNRVGLSSVCSILVHTHIDNVPLNERYAQLDSVRCQALDLHSGPDS